MKKIDISVRLMNVVTSVLVTYLVIRMALHFSEGDYNQFVIISCKLAFVATVYYFTMHRLKKEV